MKRTDMHNYYQKKRFTMVVNKQEEIKMNEEVILNLLDFDEVKRASFLFDCGMNVLELHVAPSEIRKHADSKIFWNWYKLQFSNCEDYFIRTSFGSSLPLGLVRLMYESDMLFFAVHCERIQKSFYNYLTAV